MRDYLNSAIEANRLSLNNMKDVSKKKIAELQTAEQMLQNQTKKEMDRMRNTFEPTMGTERKQLSDLKNEVSKIHSEQLNTKKYTLNCEATVDHCEN
jgi:DNA anti-recombination protein RmuC